MSRPVKKTAGEKLRRGLVILRYLFPALEAAAVLFAAFVPCLRFSYDETKRVRQSLSELVRSSWTASRSVLAQNPADLEDVDLALARSLRAGVIVYHTVFALIFVLALFMLIMTLWSYSYRPESPEGNRIRLWFRFIIPGRWLHFLMLLFPILPACFPYYVLNRFTEYYRVREVTDTGAEYYDYVLETVGFNPLVFAAVLAAAGVILFVLTHDWERRYRMDMFALYKPRRVRLADRKNAGAGADADAEEEDGDPGDE